jgi:hypothetical protein
VSGAADLNGCARLQGETADAEVEPSLAVDPSDPTHLLAAWQQDRNRTGAARAIETAWSEDGGSTWTRVVPPGLTQCSGGPYLLASDPVVVLGPEGHAYLSAIGVRGQAEEAGGRTDVVVSASSDGGRHWSPLVIVARPANARVSLDKESIVADPAHPGVADAVWVQYTAPAPGRGANTNRTYFSRTEDGGATWSRPALIYDGTDGPSETQFHQLVVLSDGTLLDAFVEAPTLSDRAPFPAHIGVLRSSDDGRTWSARTVAADITFAVPRDPTSTDHIRGTGQAVLAAAGPEDSVVLCWAEPDPSGGSVLAARSTDGGRTWGPTSTVSSGAGQPFLPGVAVAGDGTIGVAWDEVLPDPPAGSLPTEVRLAWSSDGGTTWRTTTLGPAFDLSTAPLSAQGDFLGDYQGLAGLPDGFAALDAVARPTARVGPSDVVFTTIRPLG